MTEKPDVPSRITDVVTTREVIRRLGDLFSGAAGPSQYLRQGRSPGKIGRYQILEMIGSGGFGVVYKARDTALHRDVALKVPRPEILADKDKLSRFENEGAAAAALDHPHVVRVYEANFESVPPYIASAFCNGPNLQRWIDQQSLSNINAISAVKLIVPLARAVHHSHRRGIVHRDLKPANVILVSEQGEESGVPTSLELFHPMLTDFGLAKIRQEALQDTRSSMVLGSPLYMSPEQAQCEFGHIGPATDIFSLGAILYHLLAGVPPFAADTFPGVLRRLQEDAPSHFAGSDGNRSRDLETICLKCLERNPTDRFGSADELADELDRFLANEPIQTNRKNLLGRLYQWSSSRNRIREAMFAVILISVIRFVFGIAGCFLARYFPQQPTSSQIIEVVIMHLLVTTPCELLISGAAIWNLRQRLKGTFYKLVLLLLSGWTMATLMVSLNFLPPPAIYAERPDARFAAFLLLAILFAAQTVSWYLGDWKRVGFAGNTKRNFWTKAVLVGAPVLFFVFSVARSLAS